MRLSIKEVEEDFDSRFVNCLGARYSLSGACHLARYYWVKQFVKNKTVLDAGCGSGYGDNILSTEAKRIVGIDISEKAILFAQNKYGRPNVSFLVGDLTKNINLNERFDVIISFDVLEHIKDPDKYIKTLVNYLDDNGTLIIETPNVLVQKLYSVDQNPFHFKEYSPKELKDLVLPYFDDIEYVGHTIINKYKDDKWKSRVKNAKESPEFQKDMSKQIGSIKQTLKRVFPFWVKESYKVIKLLFLLIFRRHELFFVKDIGFSSMNIDELGGVFVVCRSKKHDKKRTL